MLSVPGSDDTVVLLDYMDGPNVFENLLRVTAEGDVVWRPRPPDTGPDAWVQARIDGDEVVAYSWSGFVVRFDLATGVERGREFMK